MSTRWNLDDEWECRYYVPRSCENCGRGGWNNLCDFPLHEAIKCRNKTWRSWTPRVKDIPEKESSTAHYLTNDYISKRYFEGEPVPGDNTITEGRNEAIKNHVDNIINQYLGVTEVVFDENMVLRQIAGELYLAGLEYGNIELTPQQERMLECIAGKVMVNKIITENEEVTEMSKYDEETREKIKELFPFTCPECGAGDYQRENYCAHCGHEFGTRNEVELPPSRTEKTRKAVRVRDTTNAFLSVILYWLTATIVYGMVLIPNVPDFMDEGIVHVILLEAVLVIFVTIIGVCAVGRSILGFELVDVPRVPAMDRFRAWRQAREDKKRDERANRLQETIYQRDARIAELEDTKKELNLTIIDKNALISILEEQVKEWQDKYNKTFSSGVKKVEECKEHYEAKITAITTDRDENWIPKSNRLTFKPISASFSREEDTNQPIYINAMGLSPILKNLVNIEAEINGDTAKAIMDGNFVAFSTYVLKDVLKDGEE
jgi:uncharacterized OB-fold protein